MSGAKDIRTSSRSKKPISRLGDPVSYQSKRKETRNIELEEADMNSQASKSNRSGGSHASTTKKQIGLQKRADEIIADLDEKLVEKKRTIGKEISQLKHEANLQQAQLNKLEEENKATGNSHQRQIELQSEMADLMVSINLKMMQIDEKKLDLESDMEIIANKKKQVQQIADSDKQMAEVDAELKDDGSQHLSDVEDEVDKTLVTEDWANNVVAGGGDDEEEFNKLVERLHLLRNPELRSTFPRPVAKDGKQQGRGTNHSGPIPQGTLNSTDSTSQLLAQLLQQAMSSHSQPIQTTATDKFLARQVQGRDLPYFDGRPEQWPGFIAAFEASTKSCQFSNADNLARLQKCLKGEARKVVQSLLISPDSVPFAIKQLTKRFGSPEHIIKSMMTKARETPTVKQDKLESLIEFGTAVNNLRATIIALGCPQHLSNPILLQELVEKLPPQQQLQWMAWAHLDPSRKNSVDAFADWIETQTDLACLLCPPTFKPEERTSKGRNKDRVNAVVEGTSKSQKKRQQFPDRREKKCPCCGKADHRIQACQTFLKLDCQGRWKFVRDNRNCFSCLNLNHSSKDCRSKRECGLDGCSKDHNRLLHPPKTEEPKPRQEEAEDGDIEGQEGTVTSINGSVNSVTPSGYVSLKVIPVVLRGNNGKKKEVLAFLDDGSTLTLIDEDVAEELGLSGISGPNQKLNITCFQTNVSLNTKTVELVMESADGKVSRNLSNVKTTPNISLPKQCLKKELLKKYSHLSGLNFSTYDMGKPKILIGMDHPDIVLSREVKVGSGNAPVASRTLFGWALCGPVPFHSRERYGFHIRKMMDDELHQLVKHQFTTDAFGVKPCLLPPRSKADERAQKILDSTLTRVADGWETGLLWKDDQVQLPPSRGMAMKRLFSMEKKMDLDPNFAKQYCEKIADYQMKGFARVLSTEEAMVETSKTYYIPHFMSYNPKKPTKLRFVFDAASKSHGSSLNDHLLQGPDKLISLPGVLLKFRQRCVGFTADIKDMFHRVKVKSEDAQSQRFLWRGMDRDREPSVMEMGVLIFGAACSPSCAQEAKNRNAEDFKEEFPTAYEAIVKRHYVDDYLDSCDSPEEAIKMYHDVRNVQSKGGFNLCNWLSNSEEMMTAIPEDLKTDKVKDLDVERDLVMERVLGMFWKPSQDILTFSLSYLKANEDLMSGRHIPTKREMLSLTMSIYDPLGLIALLTIKARALLQATWRSKVDWNEEIPLDAHPLWFKWIEEVKQLPTFEVSRCYCPNFSTAEEVQLHIFGDAGEEAFGAVCYFVTKKKGEVNTSLVMSKARVAPMKTLSIPRLELQAALMCSRLAQFIKEEVEVPISRVVLWSDSSTVIKWIRADGKKFHQFVAHRVGEIQELSEVGQWKWIPTALNVADELTRMDRPCDWSPSSRWINGPKFLKLREEDWPKEKEELSKEINGEEFELRKNQLFLLSLDEPIIEASRFSSWRKLIRCTAYVVRFVRIIVYRQFLTRHQLAKKWIQTKKKAKVCSNEAALTISELETAEQIWCRSSQMTSYPSAYSSLLALEPLEKNCQLLKLCPYLDDFGVMRVRGRIDNASGVDVSTKRPVILPKNNQYTRLLVRHYHESSGHHGDERIVNEIWQKFYIPNIRSLVKTAKLKCQLCRNMKIQPSVPEMGVLPKYRLDSNVAPFTATGVDYFGPIEVNVKRSKEKRYGCLFTCLSTRAIHLEVAHSLTTDSCILAIRRFVSRRGCPQHLYSDNGTNFHGAENELTKSLEELNQTKLKDECSLKGMQWHFIAPAAPHFGGSWERMVRSVKVALGATLDLKNLSDEVLLTVMAEAEHVVNSHPLTYVPDDPDDPEALTPNHFLLGRSSNHQPIGKFDEKEIFGRKQWRIAQQLADHFWRRWIREYLPTLLRRDKWCRVSRSMQVGDVVVEVNPALSRNTWPKGRVVEVFPGKDGLVRVAEVKMSNGHIYKRPVSKLCVLDVNPIPTDIAIPSPIVPSAP